MVVLTNQISLELFDACAKIVHEDVVTESELRDAKRKVEFAWNEIERKIDIVHKEFYSLLKDEKWTKAEPLLHRYNFELNEYINTYVSQGVVQEFLAVGLRDKVKRNMIYTPGCKGLIYSEKKEEFIMDEKIANWSSLYAFWGKICDFYAMAKMIAGQMKEDLSSKQYRGTWDKYDEPTLNFFDPFFTLGGMKSALKMLENLNVLKWKNELPLLSMQEIIGMQKGGKEGKGLKRFLGAWLYYCKYYKGFFKSSFSDTTIAMLCLKYFGLPCENENAVREMIGDAAMGSDYLDLFKNKFGEN